MVEAWASAGDVASLTSRDVDDATVAVAQTVIELASNREYADTPRLKARDVNRLRKAVAFQAAFLDADPDVVTDPHTEQERAGNVWVAHRDDPADLVVAPLARMALRRLSWRGVTTIPVAARRGQTLTDDDHQWQPL